MNLQNKYEVVVGLEVHVQLQTQTKLFCSDLTHFGAAPNTQVSPVSLALPGTLPVLNAKAIEAAVKLGLALQGNIQQHYFFDRKHYFYPDLPKGYQISQHTHPIILGGHLAFECEGSIVQVPLNRIHIEEDAGKSLHDIDAENTCIDLNRAGMPLLEIVTEPAINSAEAAAAFLTHLRSLVRWIEVCDGNMEEGSMRCDANISIRLKGETLLGKRVEIKNLNSIRNVKKAIEIEMERQIACITNQETIAQETRSFDADKQITFSLRSKEESDDYRYFPEPDLPAFYLSDEEIQTIKSSLPLLPAEVKEQYQKKYGLSAYDAQLICQDKEELAFFDSLIKYTPHVKAVANWMVGPIKYYTHENRLPLSAFPVSPERLGDLINVTESGQLGFNMASTRVMHEMISFNTLSAYEAATKLNLLQEKDTSTLENWVNETLSAMPDKVKAYQAGKKSLIGLFAGEVKKRSKGKADMEKVNQLLIQKLQQHV